MLRLSSETGTLFTSSAPTVASVTSEGAVHFATPGRAILSVTCKGFSASATVDVVPVPDLITPPADETPTVTVTATKPEAFEENRQKGEFTVTRSGGDLTKELVVTYAVKGSATAGMDYRALSGTITIPAGSLEAKIKIKPFDDNVKEDTKKVVVRLLPDAGYNVGSPAKAKVSILDND